MDEPSFVATQAPASLPVSMESFQASELIPKDRHKWNIKITFCPHFLLVFEAVFVHKGRVRALADAPVEELIKGITSSAPWQITAISLTVCLIWLA